MLDFTETIPINATPARVWAALLDIERWWPPSNPEHESIERLDDYDNVIDVAQPMEISAGTRFRVREKIAGVPGEGVGVVTGVDSGRAITWEADRMRYRLYGVTFTIAEGSPGLSPHTSPRRVCSALACGPASPMAFVAASYGWYSVAFSVASNETATMPEWS